MKFALEHPYLTTLIAIVIVTSLCQVALTVWTRFTRVLMVRKHGWPPPYLDADGDPNPEAKK